MLLQQPNPQYIINLEKMLVGYFVISIMYLMPVRGHFLRGVSSRCIFKYPHSAFKQYRNMGYTNGHTIAVYVPRIYPLKIFKLNLTDRKWQLIYLQVLPELKLRRFWNQTIPLLEKKLSFKGNNRLK